MSCLVSVGDRFGDRTVVQPEAAHPRYGPQWLVLCECGTESIVREYALRYGKADRCFQCGQRGRADARRYRAQRFRELWDECGTLYDPAYDDRRIDRLRNDMADALGFYPQPVTRWVDGGVWP